MVLLINQWFIPPSGCMPVFSLILEDKGWFRHADLTKNGWCGIFGIAVSRTLNKLNSFSADFSSFVSTLSGIISILFQQSDLRRQAMLLVCKFSLESQKEVANFRFLWNIATVVKIYNSKQVLKILRTRLIGNNDDIPRICMILQDSARRCMTLWDFTLLIIRRNRGKGKNWRSM